MKEPLIILAGPTASGKTELSVALAHAVHGEIISADSMQVYRSMDIGTAKIRPGETDGIPHYLIDVLEPEEDFNVVMFQQMAKEAVSVIRSHGNIPIVVGGTGFYIQALLYDIDFGENDGDTSYRHELENIAEEPGGNEKLYEMLKNSDPASARAIHPNNVKRVIRALEYLRQTGQPISEHNLKESEREAAYNYAYFVLTRPRDELYERIDSRVDTMIKDGLADEVRSLRGRGCTKNMTSMQGLGYKEMLSWLDGTISYDEAVRILKRDTRHFAKRQLTWFKREKDVIWINRTKDMSAEDIIGEMKDILIRKEII